jgi:D-3-phosphoglycerate dehydrogenase
LSVVAHDPFLTAEYPEAPGVPLRSLDDVLASADYVTLHLPLTKESHHLIDARALSLMKPTAHLVNTARGPIVDLAALESALRAGLIAGAALDVVESEPLPVGHPLLRLPGVIVTPHVAFYSEESIVELRRRAARNVVDVLTHRIPASVVNREVLERPEWAHLTR